MTVAAGRVVYEAMTGFLVLEDGTVFRGRVRRRAEGFAFGEAVFTTAMTGYQEVVTDPSFAEQIVCFTAPMVGNYGVAAGAVGVRPRPRARRSSCARRAGRPGRTGCSSAAIVALSGIDTRSLVLHLRERGAMRAAVVVGDGSVDEALARGRARSRRWRAARSPPTSRRASRTSLRRAGRVRVAVVDYGCKRSILRRLDRCRRRRHGLPARRRRGRARALRRRPALERPRRPGAARRGGRDGARAARPGAGARHLPRPPAARARDAATRPSSSRSATAARTTRCVERATGRVLVTSQNHGFAVAPSEDREATHVSLYDGTVEGLDFPGAARALGPVPSRGGPRPARRLADPRALGRGGERPCQGGLISTRSA